MVSMVSAVPKIVIEERDCYLANIPKKFSADLQDPGSMVIFLGDTGCDETTGDSLVALIACPACGTETQLARRHLHEGVLVRCPAAKKCSAEYRLREVESGDFIIEPRRTM